LVLNVVFCL
jgi:chromosome segregation ATPase